MIPVTHHSFVCKKNDHAYVHVYVCFLVCVIFLASVNVREGGDTCIFLCSVEYVCVYICTCRMAWVILSDCDVSFERCCMCLSEPVCALLPQVSVCCEHSMCDRVPQKHALSSVMCDPDMEHMHIRYISVGAVP